MHYFLQIQQMHNIYDSGGKYNFIYLLPQTIYSSIITTIIDSFIKYLSLSQKEISNLRKAEKCDNFKAQLEKVFRCLVIRFTIFFDISIALLILFWYYLSCFCAVFRNTQIYLIKDIFISFAISILYQFIINLIPGIFRIIALKENITHKECLFRISRLLQFL